MPVRRHLSFVLPVAVIGSLLMAASSMGSPPTVAPGAALEAPTEATASPRAISIEVLSGAADQVTGGDALVEITSPDSVAPDDLRVALNGTDITSTFDLTEEGTLVGLVDGLDLGTNTLRAEATASGNRPGGSFAIPATVTLENHPTQGPIFSGPQQQPFVCTTARGTFGGQRLLGQPLVDNQDSQGIRVALEDENGDYPQDARGYPTDEAEIVGWSANCATQTRTGYVYGSTDGSFKWLADPSDLPTDVATTTTLDGQQVPFVVRWERGTINRFIYSIAVLAPVGDDPGAAPDPSLWNRRLVFSFQGGVAIGHTQGTTSTGAMLPADLLGLGYGVMWSSGTRTSTHYNLQVGGETALMVKERAVERYGVPDYTVAVGGSGGAIQQYIYAQNHPGIIDAAIPQYSYPDMVTQIIHVADCELLEHYFDVTDRDNDKWKDPEVRQTIIGLNGTDHPQNLSTGELAQWNGLYQLMRLLGYQVMDRDPSSPGPALMECKPGWFGLTPLALNPTFTDVDDLDQLEQGIDGVEWTHWGDLVTIYGTDADGNARVPWDNVGVQYGLQALRDGVISPEEFLDLNAQVGSWKDTKDLVEEGFPFVGDVSPASFDPWSSRNMDLSPDGLTPAPRAAGDLAAIRALYTSGMQFQGDIDIPIIDVRHYLEDELDMHNTQQSFATRQRMLNVDGDASNQVIWFVDARPQEAADLTGQAFAVIDQWMANIEAHPGLGVAGNKPGQAVDSCFATDGSLLAAGEDVWDGVLDDAAPGACTEQFPSYSSSRRVAGGPYEGGVWKCTTQPVARAVNQGLYGDWEPTRSEVSRLQEIFPSGVCDYTRPDAGKPRHRTP
ncbi:DUF6351 family protein [Ornithinimicrobium murale]|uniref:DUF6351 family protein n=1 Tax=Ornithinimicrobium murale TaxID=1050153 RepID=UPI00192DAB72|nr:DUF6351 family protein [Ornithinimicrobium murale]